MKHLSVNTLQLVRYIYVGFATQMCLLVGCNAKADIEYAVRLNASTEVIIVGTIHGQHLKAPEYSPEVLRAIILALKPNAILNELPLDQVETDGRPKSREYGDSEGWASDQAGSQLKVPQIPFDRPDRSEYYARTQYFQRQAHVSSWLRRWLETTEKQDPDNVDLAFVRFMLETHGIQSCFWERPSPELINSNAFDRLMYLKHVRTLPLLLGILKKSRDFTPELAKNLKFLEEEWIERNAIMAQNIERTARQYPGGRLVVLTGAEHRYALRDLLRKKKGIVLKEYWDMVDVDFRKIPPSPQRKIWETLQDRMLAESPTVCRAYWEAVIQKNWNSAAKLYPARSADHIKAEYSKAHPLKIARIEGTHMPRPGEGTMNPVTPCLVKYEDGSTQVIRMCTRSVNGKCVIVATLANRRVVSHKEVDKDATTQPSQE